MYDWMLRQQAALNLDYGHVTDAAFMGTQRVLVASEGRYQDIGAMACFDVASREIVPRYTVQNDERQTDLEAKNVATNDGEHVFAYCTNAVTQRMRSFVLGTWDQTTGQQTQLLSCTESQYQPVLLLRSRLQWLPASRLLLVAIPTLPPCTWLGLFDLRENKFLWPSNHIGRDREDILSDVVAMDDSFTFWTLGSPTHPGFGGNRLGFCDIRVGGGNTTADTVQWCIDTSVFPMSSGFEDYMERYGHITPKMAHWGSQLFASVKDTVKVLSSPNWQAGSYYPTGEVKAAKGAGLANFAVGGDRLFMLHADCDSFEVWESPRDKRSCLTAQF